MKDISLTTTPQVRALTAGELKKLLMNVPDDYELIWANQFEGRYEWVRTAVKDPFTKRLFFVEYGADQNSVPKKAQIILKAVQRDWQYYACHSDSDTAQKFKDALAELNAEANHTNME